MSNSFMAGMRSAALGGNVRSPMQRSDDQNNTVSGNPMTPFNRTRAVMPMTQQQRLAMQMQGNTGAIAAPKQYIRPMLQNVQGGPQDMQQAQAAVQQQNQQMQQLQGQPVGGQLVNTAIMQRPQWNAQPPGNIMQPVQGQAQVQQPQPRQINQGGHYGGMGGAHYTAPRWQ